MQLQCYFKFEITHLPKVVKLSTLNMQRDIKWKSILMMIEMKMVLLDKIKQNKNIFVSLFFRVRFLWVSGAIPSRLLC